MPENPLDIKPVGKLKPINTSTDEIKPVGKLKPISEVPDTQQAYLNAFQGIDQEVNPAAKKANADSIIDAIPEMPGDTESKKQTLKDLVAKGVRGEELSNSILTLQGKHPKQNGGAKYYMNDNGVPVPIANNERPPANHDVESLFGSQKQAEDDNILTSTVKHVWNGLIGAAEGAVSLPEVVYGLSTGNDSETATTLKNAAQYLKFNTKSSEKTQLLNIEGIKRYEDIYDPERWTPTAGNIQGNILNGLESVISFAVGRGLGTSKTVGAAGQKALSAVSAYNMSLNSMLDTAEDAGLTGRDKYAFAGVASIPQATLEGFTGVGGLLTKNAAAKEEFKNLAKVAAKNLERDVAGNLTKESLDALNKEMTIASAYVAKKYMGQVAATVGEEALTETAQQFVEEGSKQLHDRIKYDLELLNEGQAEPLAFNVDAFSPESVGKYINSAIGGALGAVGPSAVGNIQSRKIEKDKLQKESVYETIKKGDDAVNALKKNITESLKNGELTQEEHDNAVIKVDSYQRYNTLVENKNLNLDDNNKRELFDKTFQQEDLEARAKAMGDYAKLNPIDKAEYNGFEKQSHDLQKDINEIILKSQIKEETTVSKKTVTDVAKSDEAPKEGEVKGPKLSPQQQALIDKYKKTEETRPFAEIPTEEWNKKTYNARDVFNKTVEHLEEQPEKTAFGTLVENPFHYKNPNETYAIEMPDGKKIRFSSSMTRDVVKGEGGFKGHFRQEHFSDKQKQELEGHPMAMKVVTIPAVGEKTRGGKEVKEIKAIKIVRADTGKFIGWAKATNTGSTDVSEEQGSLLEDEQMNDRNLPPTQLSATVTPPVKPITPITQPSVKKEVKGVPSKEEFVAGQMEQLLTDEDAQVHQDLIDNGTYQRHFENQYDKVYGKTTTTDTTGQEKSTTGDNKESVGDNTKEVNRKETTLRKERTKTIKIKDKSRIDALKLEVFTAYEKAMQYFIGGGTLNTTSFRGLYQTPEQIRANAPLGELKGRTNYVKPDSKATIASIAHSLWQSNSAISDDSSVWENAVEEVLNNEPASVIEMAENLLAKNKEKGPRVQEEQVIVDVTNEAEKEGLLDEFTDAQENLEQLPDNELNKLSTEEGWEVITDIIIRDDIEGDQFQKPDELKYAEGQFKKAEDELSASKKALDNKRKELDKGLIADNEDLFGERKSTDEMSMFDERATVDARNEAVVPFKQRYEKAQVEFKKAQAKLEDVRNKPDSQQSLFQKKSASPGDVKKVVDLIRKALPKIKVVYDENLGAAGKLSADGKTITINPYFAGTDTPIHEAGHVLIDAMGYNHKDIQLAIKKLKGTELWNKTKKRYQELNEENLGKEVLAEAIGREGSSIFDKESQMSEFKRVLDRIFQWFKDKLGLERNIAKKLAKQILRGETKDIGPTSNKVEQLQKNEETGLADDLREINSMLKNPDLSTEEKADLQDIKENILSQIAESPEMAKVEEVANADSLEGYSLDELIQTYEDAQSLGEYDSKLTKALKLRIAYHLNEEGKKVLRKNDKFIEEQANKKDLSWKDVNFKVLSHMTENFPELQQLSPLFDEAYSNKVSESNNMKRELEQKAKVVIKEHNKKLGIGERVLGLFSSNNAKYFEYMDDNGKLRESTSGLSKAQIELLNHMKELVSKREKQAENEDLDNDVLKIDKGFNETFKTEGLMSAISNYFGGSNLADNQITYTNPLTKQVETSSYLDAQKAVLEYSKKGLKEKAVSLPKLLAIAYKSKKTEGKPAYGMNYKGGLTNKFDKPRSKDLGYSKDFYRAAQMFIDDYTHVKHMSKFVPIVNSLDYLYSKGYGDVLKKPNAKKWLDEWSQAQVFQTEKTTDPIIDASLKFLRTLTSQIVMGFNLPANIMNVAIGNYNSWRKENLKTLAIGNKRLFGKDGLNKYGIDVLSKYHVINMDVDSNPSISAGKLFQKLAYAGQQYGEMQIQGSVFLGKLNKEDFDSFEYTKDGDFVVKAGIDEKALIKRIDEIRNEVSDIQGKYSAKDRRNFARGEFGKNLAQFKTWMPDWWRMRFGKEYIDYNGVTKRGSWNMFTKDAIKELKNDFSKENNYGLSFENGKYLPTIRNKQVAENLKGAIAVAAMLAWTYGDDEDKNKRKKALSASNALGNLLFILDLDQMKYTISNPVASIGTIKKFIEALQAIQEVDSEKFTKNAKKLIPYNKVTDVPKQIKEIKELTD